MGPISPDVNNTRAEVAQVVIGKEGTSGSRLVAEARRIISEKRAARPTERPLVITQEAIIDASGITTPPTAEGANSDFLTRNFGTESSPIADQATQESQARRTAVDEAIKAAKLATGYEQLTPSQQIKIVEIAEKLLISDPDLKGALPPEGKERTDWIATHFLGDPRIAARIQEKIAALEAESPPGDVAARRAEVERARLNHEKNANEVERLNKELERIQAGKRGNFQTEDEATQHLAKLAKDIPDLKVNLNVDQGTLGSIERSIEGLRSKMAVASPGQTESIYKLIEGLESQAIPLRRSIAEAKSKIEDYDTLTKTRANLTGEDAKAHGELTAAQAREAGSKIELSFIEGRLTQASAKAEQALVDRAKGIIPESISEVVNADLAEAEVVYQQALTEFRAGAKSAGDKAISRQLYGRYIQKREPTLRDRRTTEANIPLAVSDFNRILNDPINGPRQLVEFVLRDGLKADGLDDNQINEMETTMMSDGAWVEAMSIIVGGNALHEVRKLGPFKEAEVNEIAKTKLGERIVAEISAEPPKGIPLEVNKVLEEARQKGVFIPDKLDKRTRDFVINNIKSIIKIIAVPNEPAPEAWQQQYNANRPAEPGA